MKKALKNIVFGVIVIVIAVIITFILRRYFFSFDKELTKEQKAIIEKYISDENNSYLEENMTFMSTHYFGDRYNNDKLAIYLWVMFSEYDTSDGKFEHYQGFSIPYVINVNTKDGDFEIISYEIPEDGSNYTKSIKEMFPLTIRSQLLKFHDHDDYEKLLDDHEEMIEIYENYSKESE